MRNRWCDVSDLIDTTEMYLRTIYELEEEGISPMRARIAERLHQSGPTVSQTVSRMERDGLVTVGVDRRLELTGSGREAAIRVMRKHRLAECLLVEVLGMPWEHVHEEACRWEHVMSEAVERRLMEMLGNPTVSPYGNPIPGLDELTPGIEANQRTPDLSTLAPLASVATAEVRRVIVRRIAEPIQDHGDTMGRLRRAGAIPGATVEVHLSPGGVIIGTAGEYAELDEDTATHVLVDRP
jgi:DtxR family transcriptional regulator, Mn-dependent transcriptional regulator